MTDIFLRLLKKRGVSDDFLFPKYEECIDPFLIPDMNKAVNRIRKAVDKQETVIVYGDYDVDGVTSSCLIYDALKLCGISNIKIMLPNRFSDGYGMNKKVVQKAIKEKADLVVTVDCGSANADIVEELKNEKIDTIVSDHHECPDELPNAVAVLNPKRKDYQTPAALKDLAGVGVAFKIAQALVKEGLIKNGQEKWLLDLVLIGTLCDSMKMSIENRRLCYYGMKVFKKTRRIGLKELINVCKTKKINSELIGFRIGPRLNASGRMVSADKALDLLMENDCSQAAKLAKELDDLNTERKRQQDSAVKEIANNYTDEKSSVIVVCGDWHEGVLGIIAGKLTEEYKKPAIVLAKNGNIFKGSGRSFGDFNLAEALKVCRGSIIGGGGHSAACGLKIEPENFERFCEEINDYYSSLGLRDQEKFLERNEDLIVSNLKEFSSDFFKDIDLLEPFGVCNEEPVFLFRNAFVLDVRKMGGNQEHLSIQIKGEKDGQMKLVSFFAPKEWLSISRGQKVDVWVSLMENEWNGTKSIEGRILKMRVVESEIF